MERIDPRNRMSEGTYIALELKRTRSATSNMDGSPVQLNNLRFDADINTVIPAIRTPQMEDYRDAQQLEMEDLVRANRVWSETRSCEATPGETIASSDGTRGLQAAVASARRAVLSPSVNTTTVNNNNTTNISTRSQMGNPTSTRSTRANPYTSPNRHTRRARQPPTVVEEENIEDNEEGEGGGEVGYNTQSSQRPTNINSVGRQSNDLELDSNTPIPHWALQMNRMVEGMSRIVQGAYNFIDYSKKPHWSTESSDHLSPLEWLDSIMGSFCTNGSMLNEQVATVRKVDESESWTIHKQVDKRCLSFSLWIRAYKRAEHTNDELIDWCSLTRIFRAGFPTFIVNALPSSVQGMNLEQWEQQRIKIAKIMSRTEDYRTSSYHSERFQRPNRGGTRGGHQTPRGGGAQRVGFEQQNYGGRSNDYGHAGTKRTHPDTQSQTQNRSNEGAGSTQQQPRISVPRTSATRGGNNGWGDDTQTQSQTQPQQNNTGGWGTISTPPGGRVNASTWGIANPSPQRNSNSNLNRQITPPPVLGQRSPRGRGNSNRGGIGYRGRGGRRGRGGETRQFNTRKISVSMPDEQYMHKMREEVNKIVSTNFLIPVHDGAIQTTAYLDTGSPINVISKHLWEQLKQGGILSEEAHNILIGTWKSTERGTKPIAHIKFKIQPINSSRFAQSEYAIDAHVVETLDPPLLLSDITAYRMGALNSFELTEELTDPCLVEMDEIIQCPAEWEKVDHLLARDITTLIDQNKKNKEHIDDQVENIKKAIRKVEIQTRNIAETGEESAPSECIPNGKNGDIKCGLEIYEMLIKEYKELIGSCPKKLSPFQNEHQLQIRLRDKNKLPKLQPERFPDKHKREAIDATIKKWLDAGFIEECDCINSPPQFPLQLVCVKKPDGTWRVCLDARPNNNVLADLIWSLPDQEDIINFALKFAYYTKMDLISSFQQLGLHELSRIFAEFQAYKGGKTYRCTRVPFGLKMGTSFLQFVMQKLFEDYEFVRFYVDDILVCSNTAEEHKIHVKLVFDRLKEAGFRFNTKKCAFAFNEIIFLGKRLGPNGLLPSEEYYKKLLDLEKPINVKNMRTWCGKVTWIRNHIPNIGKYLKPLYDSIPKMDSNIKTKAMLRRQPIVWTDEMNECWVSLKQLLVTPIQLAKFEHNYYTYIETDASDVGIGAYLYQKRFQDQEERHSIGFFSEGFDKRQQRWSTFDKELFAIVQACDHWKHYLLCTTFTVYTDHRNLTFWERAPSMKVERWLIRLQQFPMRLVYVKGEDNIIADTLSRVGHEKFVSNPEETKRFKVARISVATDERILSDSDEENPMEGMELQVVKENDMDKYSFGICKPICRIFHNSTVGHRGKEALLRSIKEAGLKWTGMKADVSKFVDACLTCQLGKSRKHTTDEMRNIAVNSPFEQIDMDTIGPFKHGESNTYILCFIDAFSRFCFLIPISTLTAIDAANALLSVVGLFGTPNAFKSDHGTQFDNQIMRNLFKLLGAERKFSIEYWSRTNGIVERVNGEVGRHLRALLRDTRTPKDQYASLLPIVQRIINSSYHSAIGMSPAKLLLGDRFNIDRVLLPNYNEKTLDYKDMSTNEVARNYYENLVKVQKSLLEISREHQDKVLEDRVKLVRSEGKRIIKNGDYVIAKPKTLRTKLDLPNTGPYRVVDWNQSDSTVLLSAPWSKKADEQGNIIKLKSELFECDLSSMDGKLEDIVPDPEQWEIEKLVGHKRRSTSALKGLCVRVRWKDFESSDDEFIRADKVPKYLLEEYCTARKVTKPQFLTGEHNALIAHDST